MDPILDRSYEFCRGVARREARNFYYSFLVLPTERRRSMCALYAFMRHTDDLADEPASLEAKRSALEAWRAGLRSALEGSPADWPGLAALADTVRRHHVPERHLFEVIDGVSMDVKPRTYRTFEDLYGYCYHVASAVGLCCIHIWGFRSEGGRAEKLAEACGIALQLTNILRDVREDAEAGRVYLPQEDLERFGVGTDELTATRASPAMRNLVRFESDRAYEYYGQARALGRLVAPVGRPVLRAIMDIYKALLDEIVRREYDVLGGRVSLPGWRKATITLRALVAG
jgi:phytoene synthase